MMDVKQRHLRSASRAGASVRASVRASARPINGVVIPAANVKHLVLRDDVVDALREGRFLVVAVGTVDEALAWLVSEGFALPDVVAWTDRVNERIRRRLRDYLRARQRFAGVGAAPERGRRQR